MSCPCEHKASKPKKCELNTPPVIELHSEECPVLFHTVNITAAQGDKDTLPPTYGAYRNTRVYYEANKMSFLYDSDGVPQILSGTGADGVASVNGQAGDVIITPENIGAATTTALADEILNREAADSSINDAIDAVSGRVDQNTEDIADKADAASVYTKTETDTLLEDKADVSDIPTSYWGQTPSENVVSGSITLATDDKIHWGTDAPEIAESNGISLIAQSGTDSEDATGQYSRISVNNVGITLNHFVNDDWEGKAKLSGVANGTAPNDAINLSQITSEGWTAIGDFASEYNKAGNVVTVSISERASLSSTPTTAFTLPAGYAPSTTLTGLAIVDNSGAMALAQVQIGTDGAVDLSSSTTTTASPVSGVITFVV